MRKFDRSLRTRTSTALVGAVLVSLAVFYGVGTLAGWAIALAVAVVAGSFSVLLWLFARMRHQREEHFRYRAFFDSLTDLPNRSSFVGRVERALDRTAQESGSVAVLVADLDDFEEVNHSLGHEAGDRLLAVVGGRLKDAVGSEGTVARLCGDEFAVLLEEVPGRGFATSLTKRIEEALKAPVELDGNKVLVSASIGVAIGGSRQDSPEGLLRNADVAMHTAKRKGKARHKVFDPGADTTTSRRSLVEAEMRRAIEEREFQVYYQPLVALKTGQIQGMEALVRWQHPTYGLIPPGEFVPLAEQTGLIVPIGRWVLQEACRRVRMWQREHRGDEPLMLSVNVSACQFRHPSLVREIVDILEESGLDPRCLKLEITESIMVRDAAATAALRELKNLGVELAMDDFGTGYSNLSYLKRLPIDCLKIDRSYVSGMAKNAEDRAIVHATVAFAEALNLEVTAEGIENAEQLAQLRELGCELGQGYHFAKPLPDDEAAKLLAAGLLHQ